MLARLLIALTIAAASLHARAADVSPEYYQLLADINGSLKVLGPSLTRGPVCAPQMIDMARQGLQGNLFSVVATKVVVEPLETGAKLAAGALGVPGAAISTYGLVRCGMSEESLEGFAKCALGEGVGLGGGKLLTAAGVDDLSGALAGAAWDKAYAAMRAAIEDYGRRSETVEWTTRGACDVTVLAHWNKRGRPGAEGGKITVSARAENCRCATGNALKQGTLRFSVPVHYARVGASQPGWRAGTPGEYVLEAQCCAQQRPDGRVHLYDPAGQWRPATSRMPDEPPAPVSTPPSAPAPIATPTPVVLWSVDNPCPACQPFKDLLDEELRAAADADQQAAQWQQKLADNQAQQAAATRRIADLERELGSHEGTGGSAFDPETGQTTEATTQADGSVLIVVKDRQGNEIERRTRDSRTGARLRAQIAFEQAALDALRRDASGLQRALDRALQLAAKHRRLAQDALGALKQCLIEECEQRPDRIMPMTVPGLAQDPSGATSDEASPRVAGASPAAPLQCSFPAVQPVTIGPKAEFGNSDAQKAAEVGKAVLGILGGVLGGGGGGDDGPFGMASGGGGDAPALDRNPIGTMQRFALAGGETAIRAGTQLREDGSLLVSAEVDESPDDGVIHQIELQRLVPAVDGASCALQVMRPMQWLHYAIYEKWWAKLRIQTFVGDGSGWKKTGDTGWMDWGSGTNVLGAGRISADEIVHTGWGSMGADRAMGGPRAAGALFDRGARDGTMPERIVVHVSRPEADPVTTRPFVLYPVRSSDGTLTLRDSAPESFRVPRFPIDKGGMTSIDPPKVQPSPENILDEIEYVPIRQ